MSSTIRDVMVEYIEVGGEHEVIKSISPRPKDKCLVSNGAVSDEHLPDQNGSHVIEQGISNNGSYSQKNGFHIPSEETEEPLRLNGSSVLDKVTTSNGDSNMNGLQISSVDVCSEKLASNGLGIHHGETVGANDLAKGDGVIENKLQISKQMNISNDKRETESDLLSLNNLSIIPDSLLRKEFEDRKEFINWQNTVIEQQEDIIKKQNAVIEDQVLSLEDANRQKKQLKRDLESMNSVTVGEGAELESVACKGVSTEPRKLYTEQLSLGLNSSEMQSKMNEINIMIECLVDSSFKPTSTVGGEIKPDSHEDGPQIESEGESKPENDELTLPKRKSEQSDSEDPEELQLLAKKPKVSTSVSTAQQQRNKSQICTRDEFRLAYAKYLQKHPVQSNKEFNFSEELSKEKSRLAKEHLDEIADRVLNAMSLDEYFHPKEMKENSVDVTVEPRGFHPKKELASRFEKDMYDFENFYTYMHHPLVRESYSKDIGSKGNVNSCLRKSSHKNHEDAMDSNSSGSSLETCGMFPWTSTKLIELFKSIILLNSFFPFLIIGYIVTQFLNFFNCSEKNSTGSKPLSQQRKDSELKDKHPIRK